MGKGILDMIGEFGNHLVDEAVNMNTNDAIDCFTKGCKACVMVAAAYKMKQYAENKSAEDSDIW